VNKRVLGVGFSLYIFSGVPENSNIPMTLEYWNRVLEYWNQVFQEDILSNP
jgi:hypothetical protein